MIGSITSHCSEKEIWLLPEKTAGHVGIHQSDRCLPKSSRRLKHTDDDINHLTFAIFDISQRHMRGKIARFYVYARSFIDGLYFTFYAREFYAGMCTLKLRDSGNSPL